MPELMVVDVSIHAPWEGCDQVGAEGHRGHSCFNSRTLGRVRQVVEGGRFPSIKFQFTHPGKGATLCHLCSHCVGLVSIHAPWEGCDTSDGEWVTPLSLFQFTHPGKGATISRLLDMLGYGFVSIHAPWEGCDLTMLIHCSLSIKFQFTHPGKGATAYRYRHSLPGGSFNSRTLGRVRQTFRGEKQAYNEFQFTHPGKGATQTESTDSRALGVSIHAPWEGCDKASATMLTLLKVFQFTHPGKGATRYSKLSDDRIKFQFTHPGKGATF